MAIGSTKPAQVDIRVISASHRSLRDLVDSGQFRQDLYYRLNGVIFSLPAFRNRKDKKWIIDQTSKLVSNEIPLKFSDEALQLLCAYSWPGNIREMINVFELCLALCDDTVVGVADLPDHIKSDS